MLYQQFMRYATLLDDLHRRTVYNLANAYKSYDDCNPDIGFGFPFRQFLKLACMNSGFSVEQEAQILREFDDGARY